MKKISALLALVLVVAFAAAASAGEQYKMSLSQEIRITDALQAEFSKYGIVKIVITRGQDRCRFDCDSFDTNEGITLGVIYSTRSVVILDLDRMETAEAERAFELKYKIEAVLNPSASVELKFE